MVCIITLSLFFCPSSRMKNQNITWDFWLFIHKMQTTAQLKTVPPQTRHFDLLVCICVQLIFVRISYKHRMSQWAGKLLVSFCGQFSRELKCAEMWSHGNLRAECGRRLLRAQSQPKAPREMKNKQKTPNQTQKILEWWNHGVGWRDL